MSNFGDGIQVEIVKNLIIPFLVLLNQVGMGCSSSWAYDDLHGLGDANEM